METVSRQDPVETTEMALDTVVSSLRQVRKVQWTSVVLVCPALISSSSGNKAHLSCGHQNVMNYLSEIRAHSLSWAPGVNKSPRPSECEDSITPTSVIGSILDN